MKKEEMEHGKMSIENNNWNSVHLNIDIDSVDFLENGYIVYYDKDKEYWDFYRYKDIRGITCVMTHDHNMTGNESYALDDYLKPTKNFYKQEAERSCYFIVWNDGNYGTPKTVRFQRKFWIPLMKIEEIENPLFFEKIKSNFIFHKYGFYKHIEMNEKKYFRWAPYSDNELKQLFDEKEKKFQEYVKELKEINKQFLIHLNK